MALSSGTWLLVLRGRDASSGKEGLRREARFGSGKKTILEGEDVGRWGASLPQLVDEARWSALKGTVAVLTRRCLVRVFFATNLIPKEATRQLEN